MTALMLLIGFILAVAIVAASFRVENNAFRGTAGALALSVLFVFVALSSIRHIGQDQIGVVVKNFGRNLPPGAIIAVNGEKGPQAQILGPGWHFWYWPGLYNLETPPVIEIRADEVGLITTTDGVPIPAGQFFAPEWNEGEMQQMLNAEYFLLTEDLDGDGVVDGGSGYKGPQASVLNPGKWRINPKLYSVDKVDVTNIEKATVGVVKSNVGTQPPDVAAGEAQLVNTGERGIWRQPYSPQKLFLNTKAYETTMISTMQQIIRYGIGGDADESEIEVRTSDGYTFPVDVRVEVPDSPRGCAHRGRGTG